MDPHLPISPAPARGPRGADLPAYVSNGLIGLRVRENPLQAGMCIVSGFVGEHHEKRIEAAVAGPYPLGGDIALDGLWAADQPQSVEPVEQAYDFATGELTSRLALRIGERRAEVEIVTFASRTRPAARPAGPEDRLRLAGGLATAVVLSAGWEAIECDRLWVRGRPCRLRARQGAERTERTFVGGRKNGG